MPRKCKINSKLKCGHNKCGDHCAIFREHGQKTLFPPTKAEIEQTKKQQKTYTERLRNGYKKMRETVHETGVKTTFYKVDKKRHLKQHAQDAEQ